MNIEEKLEWIKTLKIGDVVRNCKSENLLIKHISGRGFDMVVEFEGRESCSAVYCLEKVTEECHRNHIDFAAFGNWDCPRCSTSRNIFISKCQRFRKCNLFHEDDVVECDECDFSSTVAELAMYYDRGLKTESQFLEFQESLKEKEKQKEWSLRFRKHLEENEKIVRNWPKWEQEILGGTAVDNSPALSNEEKKDVLILTLRAANRQLQEELADVKQRLRQLWRSI